MNVLDLFEKDSTVPRIDKGFVGLFVGRSGSGKTCAEASFARYGRMYIFDSDNRIRGIAASAKWLGLDIVKNIDFDFYNPQDGFKAIDDKLTIFKAQAQKRELVYKTLCFDSCGSLIYMLALDSMRLRGKDSGRARGSLKFLHPDDYNYVSMAFRQIMFNGVFPLAEMGVNVIFSGWLVTRWGKRKDANDYEPPEEIGVRLVGPQNLAEEIIGYFDEIYTFEKKVTVEGFPPRFFVEFNGEFSKTSLGLPAGRFEITGKDFLAFWQEKIKERGENV
jgi:hypothetical protein